MTNGIDEYLIELYIRHPEEVSDEMRGVIEQQIAENEILRAVATFYREFYRELDRVPQRPPRSVKTFTETLFRPGYPGDTSL